MRLAPYFSAPALAIVLGIAACGRTYPAQYFIEAQVDKDNLDSLVSTVLDELKERGFSIRDAGADHPLTEESRAIRRLFYAKHPSGITVLLNNFFHPDRLDIVFSLMDSTNIGELSATHAAIAESLRIGNYRFREVSEAERDGRVVR